MAGFSLQRQKRKSLWVSWLKETQSELGICTDLLGEKAGMLGITIRNWLEGRNLPTPVSIKKIEAVIARDYRGAPPPPSIVANAPAVSELWYQWLSETGWTQIELARRTGLSSGTIGHIIQGERRPSLVSTVYFIEAVSKKCNYDVSDMYAQLHHSLLGDL